jgi:hypothetical protein
MKRIRVLAVCALVAGSGCASARGPGVPVPAAPAPSGGTLVMPATDEPGAAVLLAAYLLGRGWTVRLADATLVEARRGDERVTLEPLLDPAGLDRLVISRSWPPATPADPGPLAEFALELNEILNVGQFRAASEGLVFQASLPFLDALEPLLLDAFLAYTGEVKEAVLRVQGDRELLAPVESGSGSR